VPVGRGEVGEARCIIRIRRDEDIHRAQKAHRLPRPPFGDGVLAKTMKGDQILGIDTWVNPYKTVPAERGEVYRVQPQGPNGHAEPLQNIIEQGAGGKPR
jgi:hypothetical protein